MSRGGKKYADFRNTYRSNRRYDWKQDSLQPTVELETQLQTQIMPLRVLHAGVGVEEGLVDGVEGGPGAGAGGVLSHHTLTPGGGNHQAPGPIQRDAHGWITKLPTVSRGDR